MRRSETKKLRILNAEHNYVSSGRIEKSFKSVSSMHSGAASLSELDVNQHEAYVLTLILLMKLHSKTFADSSISDGIFAESLDVLTCEQLRLVKTSNPQNHEIVQNAQLNSVKDYNPLEILPSPETSSINLYVSDVNEINEDFLQSSTSSISSLQGSVLNDSISSETDGLKHLPDLQVNKLIKNLKQNPEFISLSHLEQKTVINKVINNKEEINELFPKSADVLSDMLGQTEISKRDVISPETTDKDSKKVAKLKKNLKTPFSIYYKEVLEKVKEQNSDFDSKELKHKIANMWSELPIQDQEIYKLKAGTKIPKVENDMSNDSIEFKNKDQLDSVEKSNAKESSSFLRKDSIEEAIPTSKRSKLDRIEFPNPRSILQPQSSMGQCQNKSCFNKAVYDEYRGSQYCSSDCCIKHCKQVFVHWIAQKKS